MHAEWSMYMLKHAADPAPAAQASALEAIIAFEMQQAERNSPSCSTPETCSHVLHEPLLEPHVNPAAGCTTTIKLRWVQAIFYHCETSSMSEPASSGTPAATHGSGPSPAEPIFDCTSFLGLHDNLATILKTRTFVFRDIIVFLSRVAASHGTCQLWHRDYQ